MHLDPLDDFRSAGTAHARNQHLAPAPMDETGGQQAHDLRDTAVDFRDEDLEDVRDADRRIAGESSAGAALPAHRLPCLSGRPLETVRD